jgi:hypothetical protein
MTLSLRGLFVTLSIMTLSKRGLFVTLSITDTIKMLFIMLNVTFYQGILNCTIDLLFDWFGLVCFAQIKTKIVSSHTADSKPVKQEVKGTVILPPLVFPAFYLLC